MKSYKMVTYDKPDSSQRITLPRETIEAIDRLYADLLENEEENLKKMRESRITIGGPQDCCCGKYIK
ncbi:hypothetical protein HN832_03185 [archaeon]|nr:hypothetical protein [archaeon]MBT7282393.1 hypothetical protein [archaeon]